jgi:hypothetical protein
MPLDTDLNGVEFTLIKEDEPNFDLYLGLIPLANGWYFGFKSGYDLYKLITAAGHDGSKIDTAVPQSYFNKWCGVDALGRAVWSYEDESLLGFPIFHEELWLRVKAMLSMRL